MNRDDLMNALSGLDPKYIDEAAFELHGKTLSFAAAKARRRKAFLIAFPAAAAAVIFLGVAIVLPTLNRLNKGESASMAESAAPAADAEAPAYAEEAASEAPAYADEAAGEAPAYEEEAAAEAPASTAEASEEALYEPEEPQEYETVETEGGAQNEAKAVSFGLEEITYRHDVLFVKITGILPDPVEEIKYAITGTDDGGMEKLFAEGTLDEILLTKDPLTLDIASFHLPEGTYTLSIDGESMEFDVEQ